MIKDIDVCTDKLGGGISSLICRDDEYKMNWISENGCLGEVSIENSKSVLKYGDVNASEYDCKKVLAKVERKIQKNLISETYTFQNNTGDDVFIKRGEIGISIPLADNYADAQTCMNYRCNAHIWCGKDTSYIYAVKMGVSDICFGLVLKRGAIDSYSTDGETNNRGGFVLHPVPFDLRPGESYVLSWDMFICDGIDEFYSIISQYENITLISADTFTVFEGEAIQFSVNHNDINVSVDNCAVESKNGSIRYLPKRLGEHVFEIEHNGYKTIARFFVSKALDKLVESRVKFIVNNQQFHNSKSKLNGAYLIYDNEEKRMYFDNSFSDHNASRERIGMGLLIANWLRYNDDKEVYNSLIKYVEFIRRELFDEETGCIYNTVGRQTKKLRLYNSPWYAEFMTEMYWLTGEKKYLIDMFKIECWYYEMGGDRFYPNAVFINNFAKALNHAKMTKEFDALLNYFKRHAENIMKNSTSYPKHEVNFEQTIVAPAVTHLQNMYIITGDRKYLEASFEHLQILERFNGFQPDYHLYEVAIRYWDGYWFGKRKLYGDVFPHYWTSLTSITYLENYMLTGDERYYKKGLSSLKACLCLFNEKGEASCAYLYPYTVNGCRGEYYDPWANDQDFALYYNYKYIRSISDMIENDTEKAVR